LQTLASEGLTSKDDEEFLARLLKKSTSEFLYSNLEDVTALTLTYHKLFELGLNVDMKLLHKAV